MSDSSGKDPDAGRDWGQEEKGMAEDEMAGWHHRLIRWIIEKAREFQKNIYFRFIDYAKAFDCVDHKKLWKILIDAGEPVPEQRAPGKCSVPRPGLWGLHLGTRGPGLVSDIQGSSSLSDFCRGL